MVEFIKFIYNLLANSSSVFLGNSRPELKNIENYVVIKCATMWKQLGKNLDIDDDLLNIIEKDNPDSCENCCSKMLSEWLDLNPNASWRILLDAVNKAQSTTRIPKKLETAADKLPDTVEKLDTAADKLPDAVEKLDTAADKLPDAVEKLGNAADKLPDTVEKLDTAADKLPDAVEKLGNAADILPKAVGQLCETIHKLPEVVHKIHSVEVTNLTGNCGIKTTVITVTTVNTVIMVLCMYVRVLNIHKFKTT